MIFESDFEAPAFLSTIKMSTFGSEYKISAAMKCSGEKSKAFAALCGYFIFLREGGAYVFIMYCPSVDMFTI